MKKNLTALALGALTLLALTGCTSSPATPAGSQSANSSAVASASPSAAGPRVLAQLSYASGKASPGASFTVPKGGYEFFYTCDGDSQSVQVTETYAGGAGAASLECDGLAHHDVSDASSVAFDKSAGKVYNITLGGGLSQVKSIKFQVRTLQE